LLHRVVRPQTFYLIVNVAVCLLFEGQNSDKVDALCGYYFDVFVGNATFYIHFTHIIMPTSIYNIKVYLFYFSILKWNLTNANYSI